METMKEQQDHFVGEMREFSLLHEIYPSLRIPMLESNLHDDYASFLPLDSNVVDDPPLPDLEEVFGPLLTFLSLVAPSFSSTPVTTSVCE